MTQSPAYWLAQWKESHHLTEWLSQNSKQPLVYNAIIVVTDGQALWHINGHKQRIGAGSLLAVEKNSAIRIENQGTLDFAGCLIYFDTYDTNDHSPFDWQAENPKGYQTLQVADAAMAALRLSLHESVKQLSQSEIIRQQAIVYDLLRLFYQTDDTASLLPSQRLQKSVLFIQEHYNENITREQLAAIAGISKWHYSRKFTELYGKSPSDFLTDYRIFRAQEALLTTSALSQDISRQVGFEDAHYFSRRFKAVVGVSPKHYAATLHRRNLCFTSASHAEIAIALGIRPDSVVVASSIMPAYQHELFKSEQIALLPMPQYVLNVEDIRRRSPHLIIGENLSEPSKQGLRAIAPVLTGLPHDLYALIRYLGKLFQRGSEAAHLIHTLQNKTEQVKNHIHPRLPEHATALYLRVESFGYRYLGELSSSVSKLLYQELGFAMPPQLQGDKRGFHSCTLDQLLAVNPAFLFVEQRTMEYFSSDDSMKKLKDSTQWHALDAVKNQRVCYVDTGLWINNCSAFGKPIILDKIEQFIASTQQAAQ